MNTPEERAEKTRLRVLRNKLARDRFPAARLDDIERAYGLVLQLEQGVNNWLKVSVRGELPYRTSREEWRATEVSLRDPHALLGFIRALVARYNAQVEALDGLVNQAQVASLRPIPGDPTDPVAHDRKAAEHNARLYARLYREFTCGCSWEAATTRDTPPKCCPTHGLPPTETQPE